MRCALIAVLGLLATAGGAGAEPRVFSTDQCADQYVLALAPRADIVGLSKRALNEDSTLRALAVGLPQRRATMESILGARPTLVVRYWSADARLPDALRRQGIAVAQIQETADFAGVRANVRSVATALGRPTVGEALIARMDRELAASHGAWGGARALYLTPYGFTAGPGTLVGSILAAAGLESAAASPGYSAVPLEDLVLHPPAAVVLGFFRDLAGGRQHWTIAGNGRVRALTRTRAIASLPGSMLGCPAWFAADGAAELARAAPARRGS